MSTDAWIEEHWIGETVLLRSRRAPKLPALPVAHAPTCSCGNAALAAHAQSRDSARHPGDRLSAWQDSRNVVDQQARKLTQPDNGEPRCIAFGGLRVDDAVEAAILKVVEPSAITAAIEADAQQATRRDEIREALLRDLEAMRYAADRAGSAASYCRKAANRLVAAELERRWNRALTRVSEMEARIAAHDRAAPPRSELSAVSFVTLADDLQTVWQAPTTDARLKKRIVRAVIKEVVADVDAEAGEIILFLHWMGGLQTQLRLPRRRRGQRDSTSQDIVTAVRQLVSIANDELIAGILNRNKLTTGRGNRWTRERVTALRSHHKLPVYCPAEQGQEPWLNLSKAAAYLQISSKTLRLAAECGEI